MLTCIRFIQLGPEMTLQLKATEALMHVGQNFPNYSQFNAQGHGNFKDEIPVETGSFQQVVKTTYHHVPSVDKIKYRESFKATPKSLFTGSFRKVANFYERIHF